MSPGDPMTTIGLPRAVALSTSRSLSVLRSDVDRRVTSSERVSSVQASVIRLDVFRAHAEFPTRAGLNCLAATSRPQ
jgi:hypothetical protein